MNVLAKGPSKKTVHNGVEVCMVSHNYMYSTMSGNLSGVSDVTV